MQELRAQTPKWGDGLVSIHVGTCEYDGCRELGIQWYGHFMCWDHRDDMAGYLLSLHTDWEGKCKAVGNWLEGKRPQVRKLGAAEGK